MVQTLIYLSNPAVKVENVALSLIIPHGRLVVDLGTREVSIMTSSSSYLPPPGCRPGSWPCTSRSTHRALTAGRSPSACPPCSCRAAPLTWLLIEYGVRCLKGVSSWVTCHPPGPLEAQHVGIVEHPGDLLPPSHLVPQQPLPRPAHLRGYNITLEVFCHYCL